MEPGKGNFVLVKHRQPKSASSHTDSSPEEGSAIKMTQQADTHQTESLLFGRLEQQAADWNQKLVIF